MSNIKTCGTCKHMWCLKKGKRGGGTVDLSRGHCLKYTVFPKNRPGDYVLPPGAVVRDTPNDMIIPYLVRDNQIVPHCTHHEEK